MYRKKPLGPGKRGHGTVVIALALQSKGVKGHWFDPQLSKYGSLVVSALAFSARGHRFDPCSRRGKFWCPNMLSLMSLGYF